MDFLKLHMQNIMKSNKDKALNNVNKIDDILLGQISIFDLPVPLKTDRPNKQNKEVKPMANVNYKYTLGQKSTVQKFMQNYSVMRIIKYLSSYIGIETELDSLVKTYYINFKGKIEHIVDHISGVLPMEQILYFNDKVNFKNTSIQDERLKNIISNPYKIVRRVIKRNGDFNIIVERADKLLSILPNGWVLGFDTINFIEYTEDEVLIDNTGNL